MRPLDIASLSEAYGAATLTPQALLEDLYGRIARQGERPTWISLVPRETVQDRLRTAPRGPLWGIPFAVKDSIDVAGMPTTAACPDFAYVPERSALAVERLEAAGAILIGKTNLDQFAVGLAGVRSPYGACPSVFSGAHVSGGSSSGSAVAVAAGLVSFALGTDTAGSGRVPAAFNNIVGIKPSKGMISPRGVVPGCRTLDCVSVFAGTVADAMTVLALAASYDEAEPFSRPTPPHALTPVSPDGPVRVGVAGAGLEFFGDAAAETLYRQAVGRLTAVGAVAVEIDPAPFLLASRLLPSGPWTAERLVAIGEFVRRQPDSVHPVVRGIILGAESLSAADGFAGLYRLAELTRQAEAQWRRMDMLLLPTAGTHYRIDAMLADPVRLNGNLGLYSNFANMMDLSAIAVPAGMRTDGLPFGVTLLGRAFQEGALAVMADRLHRSLPAATIGATGAALDRTPPITPAL